MKQHRSAMTLLELTIVLMIIGLLAAVAAPRFATTMRATQVRSAAIQIQSHIAYMRRVAINEGRKTTFQCTESLDQYGSPDVTFPDRMSENISVNLKDTFDPSLELAANFDGSSFLSFDLEGVPHVGTNPMQSGVITVSSPGVASYHIVIAAGSGYSRVVSNTDLTTTPTSTTIPASAISPATATAPTGVTGDPI